MHAGTDTLKRHKCLQTEAFRELKIFSEEQNVCYSKAKTFIRRNECYEKRFIEKAFPLEFCVSRCSILRDLG